MPEQIFINCMPDDQNLVEEIRRRLEVAGLSCYVPPVGLDSKSQNEMVQKIKEIASSHGCMVCLLTNRAVSSSLFISNIQLMCETARTGKVVVMYQLEQIENDQGIRLFNSHAYLVRKSKVPGRDISKVIQCAQQVIHPPARNIFQFLSRYISRKVLVRLFSAALILGVGGSILFNVLQPAPAEAILPTPTPVVLYVPFSGQSQDAGLVVDARSVPEYMPQSDPASEAPFSFQPAVILDQQDFTDPAYEHTYDTRKWLSTFMLDDVSSIAITQTNGVLQLAVAPIGSQELSVELKSKYLFNLEQLSYLGYRFRFDDYQGRVTGNSVISANFSMISGAENTIPDIGINGISQYLISQYLKSYGTTIPIGSRWHTIEMIIQKEKQYAEIFLDGEKIRGFLLDDNQLNVWRHYLFNLQISNTSDWVRMQIDEVIFGADEPILQTPLPENAPYRFTPDMVDLHEDFGPSVLNESLVSGEQYVTQSDGIVAFRFPAGKDNPGIDFQFPGKPISANNYYAARFRFTSPDDNYWAKWASFFIGLSNVDFEWEYGFLFIGAMRQELDFHGHSVPENHIDVLAYNQNAAPGNWHTLEMIITLISGDPQNYVISYWVDGYLLARLNLDDPTPFLDASSPLVTLITINSGSDRQDVFSGEIDDLIIGHITNSNY